MPAEKRAKVRNVVNSLRSVRRDTAIFEMATRLLKNNGLQTNNTVIDALKRV